MSYYGEEGCCLTCESAEEGCLCYECKCTQCEHYSGDGYSGYCRLAQRWREEAQQRREEAEEAYENALDRIMERAALNDEKDRVILFERLKLDPFSQKTLKKYFKKSKKGASG